MARLRYGQNINNATNIQEEDILFSTDNNRLYIYLNGKMRTVEGSVNSDITQINTNTPISSTLIPKLLDQYYSLVVQPTDWQPKNTYQEIVYEIDSSEYAFGAFSMAPLIVPCDIGKEEVKQNYNLIKSISFTQENQNGKPKLFIKLQTFNLRVPTERLNLLIIGLGKDTKEIVKED